MKSVSQVRLLATPWTVAHQAPPNLGFSRQEYWSGVPLPSPSLTVCAICYGSLGWLRRPQCFSLSFSGEFSDERRSPPYHMRFKVRLLRVGHDWATSLSLFTFLHWRRNGNPLQCSCPENPRDRGAWWAAVYGVAQSPTRLKRLSSSSSSSSNVSQTPGTRVNRKLSEMSCACESHI